MIPGRTDDLAGPYFRKDVGVGLFRGFLRVPRLGQADLRVGKKSVWDVYSGRLTGIRHGMLPETRNSVWRAVSVSELLCPKVLRSNDLRLSIVKGAVFLLIIINTNGGI